MNLEPRPRAKSVLRRRFVCGACDTDLTRLASPAPLPKTFGLCCEAMVLVPCDRPAATQIAH